MLRLTEHFERLAYGTENSGTGKTVVVWTSQMSLTISVLSVHCVERPVVFWRCINPSTQKWSSGWNPVKAIRADLV